MPDDRWVIYYDPDDEPFGDLLERFLQARGWSQADLARAIAGPGDNPSSLASLISKYASGTVGTPSGEMIERLAAVMGETPRRIRNTILAQVDRKPLPPNSYVAGPVGEDLRVVIEATKDDHILRRLAEEARRYQASGTGEGETPYAADRAAHYDEAATDQSEREPGTKEAAGA